MTPFKDFHAKYFAFILDLYNIAELFLACKLGEDNILAVKKNLESCGVQLVSEDIGSDYSRRVLFYPENGEMIVQTPNREDKVI